MSDQDDSPLGRALRIIELLAGAPEGMTLSEIAAATDLVMTTAHRQLATLTALGVVRKTKAEIVDMIRAWAALEQKPRRSALFLAVTAEEGGLRGSEYYAQHPIVPPGKTAAALNFDAFHPLGLVRSVVVAGAERTTLYPVVEQVARRLGLEIKPDPRPEQGSYYRSDHFPLAKAGIPAFSVHQGGDFIGKDKDFAERVFREFNARHYHQPSDEYREEWDFAGLELIARFGLLVGLETANLDRLPTWKAGDEFLPARERSFKAH